MSKPGLSFGLNLSKNSKTSKPAPSKRKPVFGGLGGGDDSDDDTQPNAAGRAEAIGELDGFDEPSPARHAERSTGQKSKKKNGGPPAQPPTLKSKTQSESAMFGDLSGGLTSRKNAEAAEELDPSIYDYDRAYDSFKASKTKKEEPKTEEEAAAARRPKYMGSLLAAASVRKRDALIAEEKKIAREREAEGEEYAGKEKFVTEAYRKQQEENRRLEEEEKRREEEEAKKNKTGGMGAFYKGLLDKGEERHQEMVKAAEDTAKADPSKDEAEKDEEEQEEEEGTGAARRAKEINEHGGSVAVNEEGEVVDKRQLLKGGLNVGAKKEAQVRKEADRPKEERRDAAPRGGFVGSGGGKGAMRERQTRMMEEQLEAALKRSRDEEEEERAKVEQASKSRKTEGEISSAKERYLARKREAEAAKKQGLAD